MQIYAKIFGYFRILSYALQRSRPFTAFYIPHVWYSPQKVYLIGDICEIITIFVAE